MTRTISCWLLLGILPLMSNSAVQGQDGQDKVKDKEETVSPERPRDPNRIHAVLGSFVVDDPFSRWADLDRLLHAALQERLSKIERIELTERLPKIELGRGVPAVRAPRMVSASDVLIFGEVAPVDRQKLDSKDVALSIQVRVVSPTGLFEPFDVKFGQSRADAKDAAERIAEAVERAVARVPQTPKRQTNAAGIAAEFQTLKQQAIRLLRWPPLESGNFFERGVYRGPWQSGKPAELERTLRAVENASLLKADDAQLLVCAVTLVYELARENQSDYFEKPSPRQKAMLERSCDYLEAALAADFNENTRGMAYTAMSQLGYWRATPHRIRPIIERIVREGVEKGWYPHQVEYSRLKLMDVLPDMKARIDLYRLASREPGMKSEQQIRLLEELIRQFQIQVNDKVEGAQLRSSFDQLRKLADELAKEKSACSRGMGSYLKAYTTFYNEPRSPHWKIELRDVWKAELFEAIDAIPAIAKELGPEFTQRGYCERIYHLVRWANAPESEAPDVEITRRFIARQVEVGNYRGGMVAAVLPDLLPMIDSDKGRTEALQWLTQLLEQYTTGGSADFERMKLARWRNHLLQSTSATKRLREKDLVNIDLEPRAGDAKPGPSDLRVKKVVAAFGQVWALRCDYYLHDGFGEIFVVAPSKTKAARVQGLSDSVIDMTSSRDYLAVLSADRGLALLDRTGKIAREFRPGDSPLPARMIRTVASDGTRFFLGLLQRNDRLGYDEFFQHELDPKAGTLKKTETKMYFDNYYQMRYDKSADRIEAQTWDQRTFEAGSKRWNFSRTTLADAVHRVSVTDSKDKSIFNYTGFELNYVYDFVFWQGRLIFATGNGLYIALPGTDKLTCVMSDLELEFFSLCPVGNRLFLGTNRGLHRLDARTFAKVKG